LIALIISDVLGDPLDIIASGPTVPDTSTPQAALEVLEQFGSQEAGIAPAAFAYLRNRATAIQNPPGSRVHNFVIGNNRTAVEAAAKEAERLGYFAISVSATHSEGQTEEIGRELAETAAKMRSEGRPICLVSGGEPVVKLVDAAHRGLGGRNQQLALAALQYWNENGGADSVALLSGGTDGEDGPTDAAGAYVDAGVLDAARQKNLDPADYLARNDAYHFFTPLGALLKTGPTHTNVCDVRVIVVNPTLRHL
jgi:hydroxypyruvate reductase